MRSIFSKKENLYFFKFRIESLAYRRFEEEYEEYLDMLLGDEEFLLKHKIERIGEKYYFGSLLRTRLNRDIAMDKLMIEMIENPKKLWKFLMAKVKNSWMEREITRKVLSKKIKKIKFEAKNDEEILVKLKKFLKKWTKKSSFEYHLKKNITLRLKEEGFFKKIFDEKFLKEISKHIFRVFFVEEIYHKHMNEILEKKKIQNEGLF